MRTVVHVGKFYPPAPGGMERVLQSLCTATADRVRNQVVVLNAGRRTVRETVDGIPVTRVGTAATAGSVSIAPRLGAVLRNLEADLMVLHEPNPWALLSLAFAPPRVPLVVWYHSDVVRPRLQYALFYHPMVRAVYGRARRIVVSSPPLGEQAAALAPYRDRTRVVPFGIDAEAWAASPAEHELAASLRGASPRPLAFFAGRMVPYKGVDVLLEAVRGVEIDLVLAGDGPRRHAWEARAAALGLDGRVRFAGAVDAARLRALYHACDLFVLPSVTRAEAFGYVQLEAMACGKPVISTRLPSGVPWVNQDGVTGLTVPPGDVPALTAALATLAADPGRRAALGRGGARRVRESFTMRGMADAALRVYEEAASCRG